jgi:hypothetical protein
VGKHLGAVADQAPLLGRVGAADPAELDLRLAWISGVGRQVKCHW